MRRNTLRVNFITNRFKTLGQQQFDRNNNERVGERENKGDSREEIGFFALFLLLVAVLTSLSLVRLVG